MIPTNRRPLSHIARERLAKEAAEARHLDRTDEGNVLRRNVRAAHVGLVQVADVADREWHRANDPIPAPRAFGGALMHPTRVKALAKLLVDLGWPDDPKAPCEPVPTLEEVLAAATAEAKRELADAERAYAAYEAGKHD
jgi:hypothetical protein